MCRAPTTGTSVDALIKTTDGEARSKTNVVDDPPLESMSALN